jgi:hypothetical protein
MAASRQEIKLLAKERHPAAVSIELKRHSDFQILSVKENGTDQPDWLLTIVGGGDTNEYKADTLDELHTMLSAKPVREAAPEL